MPGHESVATHHSSPKSPKELPNYVSPIDSISSVLFNHVSTIFGYKSFSDPELLYRSVKHWAEKVESTFFQEVDIKPGAGLAPLGYTKHFSDNSVAGIIVPGYGLQYFIESFREQKSESKFLFNVGALNYDDETGSITNDYLTALDAAHKLKLSVVSPISVDEVQKTSLLALALATYSSGHGAVNLFDGLNYSKTLLRNRENIKDGAEVLARLGKHLPANPTFDDILDKFNELTGYRLHNFNYYGDVNAETIFVTYGSLESELFNTAIGQQPKVAVISVRIPLPFDLERFVVNIPPSARTIVVIGQSINGSANSNLKSQVSAALFYHGRRNVNVAEYVYKPDFAWSSSAVQHILQAFVNDFKVDAAQSKSFIYWGSDKNKNTDIPVRLFRSLALDDQNQVSLKTKYDNTISDGIIQGQLVFGSSTIISNIDSADVSIVEDIQVLHEVNVVSTLKSNGSIIIVTPVSLKDLDFADIETFTKVLKLPKEFLDDVKGRDIPLIFVDSSDFTEKPDHLSALIQGVFWNKAFSSTIEHIVKNVFISNGSILAPELSELFTTSFTSNVKEITASTIPNNLVSVENSTENAEEFRDLPIFAKETSFQPNFSKMDEEPVTEVGHTSELAKKLSFKEAYDVSSSLRPELPVENFVVKVKENKRVTPADYDRYIFEIEFDITGTGLKYDIGEALGIHARNNLKEVEKFIEYYGLNENDLVLVPNKENQKILETRTVLQSFIENLDIFGKPPKKFYEVLTSYATNEDEKRKLQDLVSPAGAVDLKRYQDVEYYTYADILKLFPSARPPIEELVRIISPMKRREYSIASSQRVHPNAIHLLIVVVEWTDNQGRKRFGQASKYIADLQVGQELVVSVKPSVMKLPPSPLQPVIMCGLGTGLAPFKAIVEEKLWQKEHGHDIGEIYLFLGSRHCREEYLYGELWEAYKAAGIITHIGAAFSRDQPQKIYIQDRIREKIRELKTAMMDKEGAFYLCGPTWPVPDITKALQDIVALDAQEKGIKVNADEAVEELKETARYILEVY